MTNVLYLRYKKDIHLIQMVFLLGNFGLRKHKSVAFVFHNFMGLYSVMQEYRQNIGEFSHK
jgi:hypothetical protein